MKAVITRGTGTVEVAELEEPTLREPGDVILKVRSSAICGTDLHFIDAPLLAPTTALGHEFIGEVHAVGSAVEDFTVGQRVASRMFVSCGRCTACLRGAQTRCPRYLLFGGFGRTGEQLSGGQAEYVRVPAADRTLTAIDSRLADAEVLFLTDTLPTAWESLIRTGVGAGDDLTVVGAGPVGQLIIKLAQAIGVAAVYAVDIEQRRLTRAADLGAVPIDGNGAAAEQIRDLSGGGTRAAIDAVGSQSAITTAMGAVGVGGAVGLVGAILGGDLTFAVSDLIHKQVDVHPVLGNPYVSDPVLTSLIACDRLDLSGLVDLEVPIDEAAEAYAAFKARRVNKAIIQF